MDAQTITSPLTTIPRTVPQTVPRTVPQTVPTVPAQRVGQKSRARTIAPAPVRSAQFAALDLPALRAYRSDLQAEESKVSYWRRIIQARLDTVRAGGKQAGTAALGADSLRPLLTDARVSSGRTALVEVVPADDIPPLPNLGELWDRRVHADDDIAQAALEDDLTVAEAQLSTYRSALHRKLAEATGELIARYREEPTLCLSVLPLTPPVRPSHR